MDNKSKKLLKHFKFDDLEWLSNTSVWHKAAVAFHLREKEKTAEVISNVVNFNQKLSLATRSLALFVTLPVIYFIIPPSFLFGLFNPLAIHLLIAYNVGVIALGLLYFLDWQPTPASFFFCFSIPSLLAYAIATKELSSTVELNKYFSYFDIKVLLLLPITAMASSIIFHLKGAVMDKKTGAGEVLSALNSELEEILRVANQATREELLSLIYLEGNQDDYADMVAGLSKKEVLIDELFEAPKSEQKDYSKYELPIPFGYKTNGQEVVLDLAKLPHLLVGGASGGGKSNFLHHLISQMIGKAELWIIDPETVEFSDYAKQNNVILPEGLSASKEAIDKLITYMDEMKGHFKAKGVARIEDWNALKGVSPLARKVVVIDEFAKLSEDKEFSKKVMTLAQLGRKWGIHLVVATQRPDKDVITPQIRSNFTVSLAFKVRNRNNSRLLGVDGAEKITKPGVGLLGIGSEQFLLQTPLHKGNKLQNNKGHQAIYPVMEEDEEGDMEILLKHFTPSSKEIGHFMTVKDLVKELRSKASSFKGNETTLGKVLIRAGFERKQVRLGENRQRGYFVKRREGQ